MPIHIGTFRDDCAEHDCPGCPPDKSTVSDQALLSLGQYVMDKFSTIENAMIGYARQMDEAAAHLPDQSGYANACRDSATHARAVQTKLLELIEKVSVSMQG